MLREETTKKRPRKLKSLQGKPSCFLRVAPLKGGEKRNDYVTISNTELGCRRLHSAAES